MTNASSSAKIEVASGTRCAVCMRLTSAGNYIRAKYVGVDPVSNRMVKAPAPADHFYGYLVLGEYSIEDRDNVFCHGHSLEDITKQIVKDFKPAPDKPVRFLYNPHFQIRERLAFRNNPTVENQGSLRSVNIVESADTLHALQDLVGHETRQVRP